MRQLMGFSTSSLAGATASALQEGDFALPGSSEKKTLGIPGRAAPPGPKD